MFSTININEVIVNSLYGETFPIINVSEGSKIWRTPNIIRHNSRNKGDRDMKPVPAGRDKPTVSVSMIIMPVKNISKFRHLKESSCQHR